MKSISSGDYTTRPFVANKTWTIPYTYLQTTGSVFIDVATIPPTSAFATNSPQNPSGIYQQLLYKSVQRVYYNGSGSIVQSTQFYPTGNQFYVVNIPQMLMGDGVKKGSFSLTSPVSTTTILDDGQGHLISSISSSSIGNIFYTAGIAIVQQDITPTSASLVSSHGMYLTTGSQVVVEYGSTVTIYEHQVICTMNPGELNYSTNPSMGNATMSGSMSASVFVPAPGSLAQDLIFSGSMTPYFTTIGLYNDAWDLLAIAKVPRACARVANVQQSVIIRYDS